MESGEHERILVDVRQRYRNVKPLTWWLDKVPQSAMCRGSGLTHKQSDKTADGSYLIISLVSDARLVAMNESAPNTDYMIVI